MCRVRGGKSQTGERAALRNQIIRVAIIEDQRELRQALAMLIEEADGYHCTGTFRSMDRIEGVDVSFRMFALVDIGFRDDDQSIYSLCSPPLAAGLTLR